MSTVLIVDDDVQIARALRINLAARGYQVTTVDNGRDALRLAAESLPDVVLLDLGLPDIDGCEVITGLRKWTRVPIIVVSARTDPDSKVNALDLGADDYVTKPFGMNELLARLRAAVRRAAVPAAPSENLMIDTESFSVDLAAMKVWRNGETVHLTPTEWDLLDVLIRNRGRLVTQRQLLEQVWGPEYVGRAHYLRVYIGQLRHKLEREPARPRHLITEPGMGYCFKL